MDESEGDGVTNTNQPNDGVIMSSTGASTDTPIGTQEVGSIEMKLEVVTLPVSDVDRAKRFYQSLHRRPCGAVLRSDSL
jgi:hypothetical protein